MSDVEQSCGVTVAEISTNRAWVTLTYRTPGARSTISRLLKLHKVADVSDRAEPGGHVSIELAVGGPL